MKRVKYKDFPFEEIVLAFADHINDGWTAFQKFSCAKCGQRLTIDVPNQIFKEGTCDQCGHITNIEKQGCNYVLMKLPPDVLNEIIRRRRN